MKRGYLLKAVLCLVVAAACWQLAQAGWIPAKAVAAQYLLDLAWRRSQHRDHTRPWPWADTWPVARLFVPGRGVDQIVLAGDSGATLAFGPGMSFSAAKPDEPGTVMISGHRDTHFRFLRDLAPGDRIVLQTAAAGIEYRVRDAQVIDSRDFVPPASAGDGLLLVTCYPFDALRPGGTLRYLVYAEQLPAPAYTATIPTD